MTNAARRECDVNLRGDNVPRHFLQVVALISRTTKNCRPKGTPVSKATRAYAVFKGVGEGEETEETRISWCETTAHRPSHAEIPTFFPRGMFLSLSLSFFLERTPCRIVSPRASSDYFSKCHEGFLLEICRNLARSQTKESRMARTGSIPGEISNRPLLTENLIKLPLLGGFFICICAI